MATVFVALLVSDLVTEGFTADHLIARLVVFGVGWFAGMLVIRRRARRATDDPDGPDDAGS
ncbi:hypothetical protein E1286_00225 [Nonomuraea terrae]|uniref:Uncharacterized protein n=1 Tax=Nonomuraea terrae TaxID=2530383 RepID=A0A4R4ZGK6_9ACTN|nr:hypothetical protein [Nonomuraea terrae]TDD57190.1 hypothetical protein E1286_00225 [Nonomuraea terrae]